MISSRGNLLGIFFSLPGVVIAIIMLITVIQAKKGKIVSINTIKGISIAGIIISALMLLFANPIVGAALLGAAILYLLSIKNIKLAKIGAILAMLAILCMFISPFIKAWMLGVPVEQFFRFLF